MISKTDQEFEYDGVKAGFFLSDAELKQALEGLDLHVEEAEEKGESRDGHTFCGCSTCYERVTSGYWISWTIKMIRQGKIRI